MTASLIARPARARPAQGRPPLALRPLAPRARAPRLLAPLGAGLLAAALAHGPAAAEPWRGLAGLRRVAVEVTLSPDHPQVLPDVLAQRVEDVLRVSAPALRVEARGPDVLRLAVGVRAYSSSELRGYYLPFSGSYGIGPVRLAVERAATVAGAPAPVAAVVWQAERLARGPWPRSGQEIRGLLEELLEAFLDDYRQAGGR